MDIVDYHRITHQHAVKPATAPGPAGAEPRRAGRERRVGQSSISVSSGAGCRQRAHREGWVLDPHLLTGAQRERAVPAAVEDVEEPAHERHVEWVVVRGVDLERGECRVHPAGCAAE